MAADALFGLPRKKSSGESFEAPKHGDRFFLNQTEVDGFIEQANSQPEVGQSLITHKSKEFYPLSELIALIN